LFVQGLVEAEFGGNGPLCFGRQLAFAVERSTGRGAHHQEGHRDNGQHGRNCDQQAPERIAPGNPSESALQHRHGMEMPLVTTG